MRVFSWQSSTALRGDEERRENKLKVDKWVKLYREALPVSYGAWFKILLTSNIGLFFLIVVDIGTDHAAFALFRSINAVTFVFVVLLKAMAWGIVVGLMAERRATHTLGYRLPMWRFNLTRTVILTPEDDEDRQS